MQTRKKVIPFKEMMRKFTATSMREARKKDKNRVSGMSAVCLSTKRAGDKAMNMGENRKRKREEAVQCRNNARSLRKKRRTIGGKVVAHDDALSNVNEDARKYHEHFNGKTCMWICAVCGTELGEVDLKLLEGEVLRIVENSDMPVLYSQVTQSLCDNAGSIYEAYLESIRSEFNDMGLLRNAWHVCHSCVRVLRKGKYVEAEEGKAKQTAENDSDDEGDDLVEDENADDSDSEEEANVTSSFLNVPRTAYLRGLYPGVVPPELRDLRVVELSMISLYNPITRLRLNCKGISYKYFHGNANTYSVVNDVTKVASVLPQLPSIQSFAILRYTNDVCAKDLKYRPGIVRKALTWLKENNHLYQDITIRYPEEWAGLGTMDEMEPECMTIDESEANVMKSSTYTDDEDNAVDVCSVTSIGSHDNDNADVCSVTTTRSNEMDKNCDDVVEDSTTDVLLADNSEIVSQLESLRNIIAGESVCKKRDESGPIMHRSSAENVYVNPYTTPYYYWEKCFPSLYPYGRGGPSDPFFSVGKLREYHGHVLRRGGGKDGRRFQGNAGHIFATYTYEVKRRVGNMSYAATRGESTSQSKALTSKSVVSTLVDCLENSVEDEPLDIETLYARTKERNGDTDANTETVTNDAIVLNQVKNLLQRLVPYAKQAPGTPMHMNFARKNMLSMITSSVIVNHACWRWFLTFAFADLHESRLFEIIMPMIDQVLEYEERSNVVCSYDKKTRTKLLRQHPALVARIFHEKQECLWQYILCGTDHPIGIIEDFMRRVEFQARGTPHVHALVAIQNDGVTASDLTSSVTERQKAVSDLVSDTITCHLQYPEDLEESVDTDYYWRPMDPRCTEEDYAQDVRRLLYSPKMDFRLDENNEFVDPDTKLQYYRYQCTNQMHRCMDTCWKYNYSSASERKCRFHYPVPEERSDSHQSTIYTLYDNRKRKQVKIGPPRNNAWLNPLPVHPLVVFANQGNMDIQYISNANGAVEYTCGYISKNDEPDQKTLINVFAKKLAQVILRSENADATQRQQLNAAGTAIAASQHVGAVQCAYTMLGLAYITLSRPVYTISPVPTSKLTKNIITDMRELQQMNPGDSTVSTSATSHPGRRYAYHLFCKDQYDRYGVCNVSLSTMQSTYALSRPKRMRKNGQAAVVVQPKLLVINTYGEIENIDDSGYTMFDVGPFRYKAHPRPCVLRMSPYIRTNEEDESSAHAMLLLYVPWPPGGEEELLRGESSAVAAFQTLKVDGKLPTYVLTQIESFKRSEELLNDLGELTYASDGESNKEDGIEDNSDVDISDDGTEDEGGLLADTVTGIDADGENVNDMEFATNNTTANVEGVGVVTKEQYTHYAQYISNQVNTYFNQYMNENCITGSMSEGNENASSRVTLRMPVDNEDERITLLAERVARLTPDQRSAYHAILPYIKDGSYNGFVQYITGGAGVGKSEYIKCIIEATRLHHGKQRGKFGSVLVMGPTGGSAHNIGGFTWQSLLGKGRDKTKSNQMSFLSQQKAEEVYSHIRGAKLLIIDEISMVSLESLHEINRRICEAMCTAIPDPKERKRVSALPFAGITTVLCGDLYQLSCVGGTPIYATTNLSTCAAAGRRIWCSINAYHDFKTSTRFERNAETEIPPLELFLNGARTGNPASKYINLLNSQLCLNYEDAYNKCNEKAVWLASTHDEKNPVNRYMFEKLKLNGNFTMDILAKHTRNDCPNDYMTRKEREYYYTKVGKDRAPILIRLAIGSRVKITENLGTSIGIYNGALGTVVRFLFSGHVPPSNVKPPYATVTKRPIPIVLVQLDENVNYTCLEGVPNVVPITAVSSSACKKVNRLQLPLVPAHACTIHSVQGLTATNGVVLLPATKYNAQGLMYVACSRPRKLEDLWLLGPLYPNHFQYGREAYKKIKKEYTRLKEKYC